MLYGYKKMDEYKLTDINTVTSEILGSRSALILCKNCIKSGTAKSICLTPSYKDGLPYYDIINAQEDKRILLVGNEGLAKSFCSIFPFLNVSIVSFDEAIKHHDSSSFLVLATHMWWQYIQKLNAQGFIENEDYMVYHTYLR